jgi:hypothetical protein
LIRAPTAPPPPRAATFRAPRDAGVIGERAAAAAAFSFGLRFVANARKSFAGDKGAARDAAARWRRVGTAPSPGEGVAGSGERDGERPRARASRALNTSDNDDFAVFIRIS